MSMSPAALAAAGFDAMQWHGQKAYARPGNWIVRLDGLSGHGAAHLKQANALLTQLGADLQATQDLGGDGLVLVNSPKGKTFADVQRSLKQLKSFSLVESPPTHFRPTLTSTSSGA